MIDRKTGPAIHEIKRIDLPPFWKEILNNGIPLIIINAGTQELVNIEVVQKGARFLEQKKGVAKASAKLLKEGTPSLSSAEIAEKIDFYGASLATGASLDFSYGKLFTLSKYFQNLLPIYKDILFTPTFPEQELSIYKVALIEKLKAQRYKNDVVAYRHLTEKLFGTDHPYGYNSTEDIIENISREDISAFHKDYYLTSQSAIIVSGRVTEEIVRSIKKELGNIPTQKANLKPVESLEHNVGRYNLPSSDKSQLTIKIGRRLFNMSHPDYFKMFIANVLLGGFFGSRLMKKIREEKGFTYGISSSLDTYIYDGYFSINTDVSPEHSEETIRTIYEEIDHLIHGSISDKELAMVKNYINGNILNLIDGPFRLSGIAKTLFLNDLSENHFQNLCDSVTAITKEEIQHVVHKYLKRDEMIEVIV